MNQVDLIKTLSDASGLSAKEVKSLLNAFTAVLAEELSSDGEANFPGMGKFVVRDRAARIGRNPMTGETIQIAASRTVAFRASKKIKDFLN